MGSDFFKQTPLLRQGFAVRAQIQQELWLPAVTLYIHAKQRSILGKENFLIKMEEKAENKDSKPVLSKANKVFILTLAIIFFAFSIFNVYLEIRRQFMCNRMATQIGIMNLQTVQNPSLDINDYILRKEAFENVCLERTGIGSYFWVFASFWFLGYAITLFGKHAEKGQTADKKI